MRPLIACRSSPRSWQHRRECSQPLPPPLAQVGGPAWLEQHDWVEKLNLQAHLNAQSHSDEFVKEALVSLDRVTVLVKDLLLTEVGLLIPA